MTWKADQLIPQQILHTTVAFLWNETRQLQYLLLKLWKVLLFEALKW